jgi:hypothetical protein
MALLHWIFSSQGFTVRLQYPRRYLLDIAAFEDKSTAFCRQSEEQIPSDGESYHREGILQIECGSEL